MIHPLLQICRGIFKIRGKTGNIVDSTTDGSKERLCVDAMFAGGGNSNSCHISNKFRIHFDDTDITISSSYQTIHNRVGSGLFFGFILDFNSDNVWVKLTIDSNIIFELTLYQVEDIQSFSSSGCDDESGSASLLCGFIKKVSGNKLIFCSQCPIEYQTELKIEAKKKTGSSDKTLTKRMIFLTEE